MSIVTNVILHIGIFDDDTEEFQQKLQEINAFFGDSQRGFVYVDDESLPRGWYGGSKMLEATLLIGAFNYLDLQGLINHLKTMEWESPEDLQLIVKEHGDDRFSIIQLWEDKRAYLKEKGFPENKRPVDENGMRYDYVLVEDDE